MPSFENVDLIYENPLAAPSDIEGWRMEGEGAVSFPMQRMRMENAMDMAEGQKANIVHWCPEAFPDDVSFSWNFWPIREPGLAILFFAATGQQGEDVLSEALAPRNGPYGQYHHGDIHALHVSYFRRRQPEERVLHTCNLRKSFGFHLVCQGADPIPAVSQAKPSYRIELIKSGPHVAFFIEGLPIFSWHDDGKEYGPLRGAGQIGFRQMAPLKAEYNELKVHRVKRVD